MIVINIIITTNNLIITTVLLIFFTYLCFTTTTSFSRTIPRKRSRIRECGSYRSTIGNAFAKEHTSQQSQIEVT